MCLRAILDSLQVYAKRDGPSANCVNHYTLRKALLGLFQYVRASSPFRVNHMEPYQNEHFVQSIAPTVQPAVLYTSRIPQRSQPRHNVLVDLRGPELPQ